MLYSVEKRAKFKVNIILISVSNSPDPINHPLTPINDQDRISPYNINTILIQYQADKWWEKRKILTKRLLVDPIPNSPN